MGLQPTRQTRLGMISIIVRSVYLFHLFPLMKPLSSSGTVIYIGRGSCAAPQSHRTSSKRQRRALCNLSRRIPPNPLSRTFPYTQPLPLTHPLPQNYVRRALWPERYGPPEMGPPGIVIGSDTEPFDHTDHCVNILRENILCNADITPNVWQWDESRGVSFPHFDSIHTCRNFDAIRDWAMARKIDRVWNASIHVGHEHGH